MMIQYENKESVAVCDRMWEQKMIENWNRQGYFKITIVTFYLENMISGAHL